MQNFFAPLSLLHHHCTAIIFDFRIVITVFSSEILDLNAICNNFFIAILFPILIACKYYTTFNVLLPFFSDLWICVFSLCWRVSIFFHTPCSVYVNQSIQEDTVIKRCSKMTVIPIFKKVVEKIYLWVSSFLIEMQFVSMQLDFHRKNKIHQMFLQVSFKNFQAF